MFLTKKGSLWSLIPKMLIKVANVSRGKLSHPLEIYSISPCIAIYFSKPDQKKRNIVIKYFWNLTTLDKGVLIMDLKI